MVEFAHNDSVNESTGYTPFYGNIAEHPRNPLSAPLPHFRPKVPAAEELATQSKEVLQQIRDNIAFAQERQKK
jgi:hypothetical protein